MAHKKQGGSTTYGRDSKAKRLGLKAGSGQMVWPGVIIIRQRGTKFHPGTGVRRGRDDTLYAVVKGKVSFKQKKVKGLNGKLVKKTFVNVDPVRDRFSPKTVRVSFRNSISNGVEAVK